MKTRFITVVSIITVLYTGGWVFGDNIIVKSPNGGGVFAAGASTDITWTTSGNVGWVTIRFTKDNGNTWDSVAGAISNTGSSAWKVPDISSDSCRIMVADTTTGGPFDVSDSVFRIIQLRRITVKYPNGGDSLQVGTRQKITWSTIGLVDSVRVEFSKDNGNSWILFSSRTLNTGTYNFYVPDIPANSCVIKICSSSDTGIFDKSDSAFSIYNPNIAIVNHTGIPGANLLSTVGPNPVKTNLECNFGLATRGNVSVAIYSMKGSLIKRLAHEVLNAGYYTLRWDCTDLTEHPVSDGLYCIQAQLGKKVYSKIVTVMK